MAMKTLKREIDWEHFFEIVAPNRWKRLDKRGTSNKSIFFSVVYSSGRKEYVNVTLLDSIIELATRYLQNEYYMVIQVHDFKYRVTFVSHTQAERHTHVSEKGSYAVRNAFLKVIAYKKEQEKS
jgi:hypothetical protein